MDKQQFELTETEFAEIKEIAARREPVMKFGNHWSGNGPQEAANEFWKRVARKYGFIWDSAESVPGQPASIFKATPHPQNLNSDTAIL